MQAGLSPIIPTGATLHVHLPSQLQLQRADESAGACAEHHSLRDLAVIIQHPGQRNKVETGGLIGSVSMQARCRG